MEIEQQEAVISLLASIRQQSNVHLPIGHSFIPYDILLAVIEGSHKNEELTVKALFTSLPYSDMGLRHHFKRLIENGWIELHATNNDKRVKQVKPTEKLTNRFTSLSNSIKPLLNGLSC